MDSRLAKEGVMVATSNLGKLREIQDLFMETGIKFSLPPSMIDVEETGTTFLDNATLKASQYAVMYDAYVLADDSGLMIHELNGAPGVHSARFAKTDAERIIKVMTLLENVCDRSANFISALVLADPYGKVIYSTVGVCSGVIARTPQGTHGFGYDPVFIPNGMSKTFAELSTQEKNKVSHRSIALNKFLIWFKSSIS